MLCKLGIKKDSLEENINSAYKEIEKSELSTKICKESKQSYKKYQDLKTKSVHPYSSESPKPFSSGSSYQPAAARQ